MRRKKQPKPDKYEIEHYPITGLHFPKVNGRYLDEQFPSGLLRYSTFSNSIEMMCAKSCKSRKDAELVLKKFKEQHDKDGMRTVEIEFPFN